jgi:nucleotide-binding universal stress UspA family protein
MTTNVKQGSVVVGVDGSPGSDIALEWAVHHADVRRRPLLLVTAAGEPTAGHQLFGQAETRADLRIAARRVSDRALGRVRRLAPDLDVEVTAPLADPREALLDLAPRASMLVVGTRGRGSVRALLLGSVSTAVSAYASCPVAVVRAGQTTGPAGPIDSDTDSDTDTATGAVVVGVDAGPSSTAALELAFELASVDHRRLDVVHSWSTDDTFIDRFSYEQRLEHLESHERALGEALAGYAEKYPDVTVVRHLPDNGPAHSLVRLSSGASVVVVGSRGLTGIRSVFGSVSRDVVEGAHSTVVVVR